MCSILSGTPDSIDTTRRQHPTEFRLTSVRRRLSGRLQHPRAWLAAWSHTGKGGRPGISSGLGFDAVGDEVFRDLVIARVVEPTSVLLDADRVLAQLGRAAASLSTRTGAAELEFAVGRKVQNRTGLSLRRVLRALQPLRSATVAVNGITTIPSALNPED